MSISNISGVTVKGISCTVPRNKLSLVQYAPNLLDDKQAKRLAKGTGFLSLRIASEDMTTSDLVAKASESILSDVERETILVIELRVAFLEMLARHLWYLMKRRKSPGGDGLLFFKLWERCTGHCDGKQWKAQGFVA